MTVNEKIDLLIQCQIAGTEEEREAARQELRRMANPGRKLEEIQGENMEFVIREFLTEMGIPCRLTGFRHLVTAIASAVKNPGLLKSMTQGLYPYVAQVHGTTVSRVERASRHAIEVAFDRCDWEVINRYFGNTVSADKGRPTLGEFIARAAVIVAGRK